MVTVYEFCVYFQCAGAKKHQIDFEDIRGRGLDGSSSDSDYASDVEIAKEDLHEVCAFMHVSTRWKTHLKNIRLDNYQNRYFLWVSKNKNKISYCFSNFICS